MPGALAYGVIVAFQVVIIEIVLVWLVFVVCVVIASALAVHGVELIEDLGLDLFELIFCNVAGLELHMEGLETAHERVAIIRLLLFGRLLQLAGDPQESLCGSEQDVINDEHV